MSYHLRQRYGAPRTLGDKIATRLIHGNRTVFTPDGTVIQRKGDPFPGLGGLTETVQTIASAITPAADIATDPYLPEVICRAKQLVAIEDGVAVPACQSLPGGMRGGIGFRKVMLPLRAYVTAERNPILYPVAFAVAVGVPLLIGYAIGKKRS